MLCWKGMLCSMLAVLPGADEVQRPVLPDERSESDEGSSSEEEDMNEAEHTGAVKGSPQLPPASSAGEQQSNGISPPPLQDSTQIPCSLF